MDSIETRVDACDCEPFVYMPAWWSGFIFQLMTTRDLAVYTYIAMLGVPDGISRPTIRQIREDMGLYSDTVVFAALNNLEKMSFIRRLRKGGGATQNAYVRPACETTLLQLLEHGTIDHRLRPVARSAQIPSDDVTELTESGLRLLLGDAYESFASAPVESRKGVLMAALRKLRMERPRHAACNCD
ncbi:MAG TPA: hypothetical protein VKT72_00720 [Candidatus Baltobacteraceae bacterium]|nr:hypothetical protein [Candidatus Baltobacteraceae bacterium]